MSLAVGSLVTPVAVLGARARPRASDHRLERLRVYIAAGAAHGPHGALGHGTGWSIVNLLLRATVEQPRGTKWRLRSAQRASQGVKFKPWRHSLDA